MGADAKAPRPISFVCRISIPAAAAERSEKLNNDEEEGTTVDKEKVLEYSEHISKRESATRAREMVVRIVHGGSIKNAN